MDVLRYRSLDREQPVRPEQQPVRPTIRLDRFRDSFEGAGTPSLLHSQDFRQAYRATVEGTSFRATRAKEVEARFNATVFRDEFQAAVRAPVALRADPVEQVKASQLVENKPGLAAPDFIASFEDLGLAA